MNDFLTGTLDFGGWLRGGWQAPPTDAAEPPAAATGPVLEAPPVDLGLEETAGVTVEAWPALHHRALYAAIGAAAGYFLGGGGKHRITFAVVGAAAGAFAYPAIVTAAARAKMRAELRRQAASGRISPEGSIPGVIVG